VSIVNVTDRRTIRWTDINLQHQYVRLALRAQRGNYTLFLGRELSFNKNFWHCVSGREWRSKDEQGRWCDSGIQQHHWANVTAPIDWKRHWRT